MHADKHRETQGMERDQMKVGLAQILEHVAARVI